MHNHLKKAICLLGVLLILAALLSSCRKSKTVAADPETSSAAGASPAAESLTPGHEQQAAASASPAAPSNTRPTIEPQTEDAHRQTDGPLAEPPVVTDSRPTPAPEPSATPGRTAENGKTVIDNALGIEVLIPEESDTEENEEKLTRIETLINLVFQLQTEFREQLYDLEGQAVKEYLDLPQEERTKEKQEDIALKYYGLATELENRCDSRIDSICAELQLLITQVDGDQAVVREIRTEYSTDKAALREEYMTKYGSYLD